MTKGESAKEIFFNQSIKIDIIGGIGTGVASKLKGQFMQSIEVRTEIREWSRQMLPLVKHWHKNSQGDLLGQSSGEKKSLKFNIFMICFIIV